MGEGGELMTYLLLKMGQHSTVHALLKLCLREKKHPSQKAMFKSEAHHPSQNLLSTSASIRCVAIIGAQGGKLTNAGSDGKWQDAGNAVSEPTP